VESPVPESVVKALHSGSPLEQSFVPTAPQNTTLLVSAAEQHQDEQVVLAGRRGEPGNSTPLLEGEATSAVVRLDQPEAVAPQLASPDRTGSAEIQQQISGQQTSGNDSGDSSGGAKDAKPQATGKRGADLQRDPGTLELPPQMTSGIGPPGTAVGQPTPAGLQSTGVARETAVNTTVPAQPTRQISLKLEGSDSTKVNVQLTERAGTVQIAVRTADQELTKSLQGDLGDLVGRLASKGFKTEAWTPDAARHSAAAPLGQSNSPNSQGQPEHSGSGARHQQPRQGQNGSNQRDQPRWPAQMDDTLATEETRKENE